MYTVNMLSSAEKVKGQGVASAYIEQVSLLNKHMKEDCTIYINRNKCTDIMHYHTIDLKHYFMMKYAKNQTKNKSVNIGYVHFVPETLKGSIDLPKFAMKVFSKYVVSFYKNMDYLVTVNSYFTKVLQNYGIEKDRIVYIPNFVSDKNFYPVDTQSKLKLRKKYGIKENEFVVLSAGQVQTRKGVTDFIEVAEKLPDVKFLWAGGFSFGHISSGYKDLKKIVENPPKNVVFLGILEREQMVEVYNIANVFFLPSYQELFPMTILEAFNCKLPLLLRDLDIYPEVFFDFYLKASNNDGFVQELKKIKESSTDYQYWQDQSWKGHNFYSEENIISMWKDFYSKARKIHQKK